MLGLHAELLVLPLCEASGGGDEPIGAATASSRPAAPPPTAEAVEQAPCCRASLETRLSGVWLLSLCEEDPRRRPPAAAAETPLARLEVAEPLPPNPHPHPLPNPHPNPNPNPHPNP